MRKAIIESICILFVLLFVYTAVSKLLDFQNFKAVIGQSPLITKFVGPISILVPALEIGISLLLVIPRFRLIGLILSFSMMILFTIYIIILVTLSDKIPCSCGGVISEMSWDQHLYFNVAFVLIGLAGIVLQSRIHGNSSFNNRLARS